MTHGWLDDALVLHLTDHAGNLVSVYDRGAIRLLLDWTLRSRVNRVLDYGGASQSLKANTSEYSSNSYVICWS